MKSRPWIQLRVFLPLLAMLLMAGVLIFEQRGIDFDAAATALGLLPARSRSQSVSTLPDAPGVIILYNGQNESIEGPYLETARDTLDAMRIPYQLADVAAAPFPALGRYRTVLVCSRDLDPLTNELVELVEWIENGGKMGFLIAPLPGRDFDALSRMMGIIESNGEMIPYEAFEYTTDIMPLMRGVNIGGDGLLDDYALSLQLDGVATVHMTTADAPMHPLMWTYDLGKGRIAVLNHMLANGKDGRGYVLSALCALEDALVYPIINAGLMFIDDFPAPQPEGFDERLLNDFGYDIKGFFRNLWWPSMKQLTYDIGLKCSGVLIETYNDQVEGPFEPEDDGALLRFYASEILHSGGEIGYHGYNHQPLCLDGFPYPANIPYVGWPSVAAMEECIAELARYGKSLFPQAEFQTYVPPSNFLSEEGQAALRRVVPGARAISGLYLYETGVPALVQEFREEEDGSISVPRVSSGFLSNPYSQLVIAQEMALHGVFSHFIHPDDVLAEDRGATAGWDTMYQSFVTTIHGVKDGYAPLRFFVASEGAAAVQRYDRLGISRHEEDDRLLIGLSGYYDGAWLALSAKRPIENIRGAEVHRIVDGFYWLHATSPNITIEWGAGN